MKFKIFIVHYKPLKDRKEYIDSFLSKTNLPFEYSTEVTRDNINYSYFSTEYSDIQRKNERTTTPVTPGDYTPTKPIMANTLEHLVIYKKIIKEDLDFGLVLEDDAVFVDNFESRIEEIINNLPDVWDTIFATNGCENRPDIKNSDDFVEQGLFYESLEKKSWTGGAYFIKNDTAKNFLDNIKPIVYPPDFEITYLQNLLDSKVYWLGDPIVYEGSNPVSGKYYKYGSSVER
jgi:hypothetical protein